MGGDFLESDDVKRFLWDLEKTTLINKSLIKTKEDEIISITDLCTGGITMLNQMFLSLYEDPDFGNNNIQNFNFCGDNILKLILEEDYLQKYDKIPIFLCYCPWWCIDNRKYDVVLNNVVMSQDEAEMFYAYYFMREGYTEDRFEVLR